MTQITRWVEPCAGMLAVALRLRGGAHCVPPIAYMGGKRGYAAAILDGLGVASGSGCRDLWVADAGPAGAFWHAVATDAGAVVARLHELHAESERIGRRALWDRLTALPETHDGTDAAAWLVAAGWAFSAGNSRTGLARLEHRPGIQPRASAKTFGSRLCALPDRVYRDARAIPIEVEGRTVVFLDPPYDATTGYSADLPREDVRDLALAWYAAGAEVLISEREPVVPGWRAVKIHATATAWEWLTISPNVRWQGGEALSLWGDDGRAPGGSAMTGGVGRKRKR